MDVGMHDAQRNVDPGHDDEEQIGMPRHPGKNGQHIKQNRHFELIEKGVADLEVARRPVRLAQRNRLPFCLPAYHRRSVESRHPDKQHEGECHLNKQRKEDGLD
jgi:hypothetical protein